MEKDTATDTAAASAISAGVKLSLNPINSLFSDTWALYKERFVSLVRIVLLPVLVTILGYTISDLRLPFSSALGGVVLFIGWLLSVFNILPIILSIQNKTDIDDSYKAAMPLVLPFAWLVILEVLAVVGAFVMFIIPGVWLVFAFSFVSYIFVLEGRRGVDVLWQSKNYVKGHWWAVVARMVLMGIFVMMAAVIVQWLTVPMLGMAAGNIASMILTLFTTPFTAIFGYNLYRNLKTLKPELAEAPTASSFGRGFIKASVIVGIVALIVLAVILFARHGVAHSFGLSRWVNAQ